MWKSALEELSRSPIAVISGAGGVLVSGLSLLVAWLQFQAVPPNSPPTSSPIRLAQEAFSPANLLLAIAFFLATTFASALGVRILARKHELAALCLSVPLAALTNFATMVVMYLAPPRALSQDVFTSANDLALYGSGAVFLTLCGRAVAADIAASQPRPNGSADNAANGLGVFFIGLILLGIWGGLVFAGQIRLSQTFLPESVQPRIVKPNQPNSTSIPQGATAGKSSEYGLTRVWANEGQPLNSKLIIFLRSARIAIPDHAQ